MKRKLKKILVCSFSLMMVLAFNVSMINAEENNTSIALQQRACEVDTMYPIPDEGEVILLEDNSTIEPLNDFETLSVITMRAASRVNVNRSYSIRIQDQGGSCVSSAKVTVKGAYTYN